MKYICEKDHCKWVVLDEMGKKGICSVRNCPYVRIKKPSYEINWAGLVNNEKKSKYSSGKRDWTPKMVKTLKQMYNNGKAISAISTELEISYYLVNNKISELIENGELSKRDRVIYNTLWTDKKINKLKEMYQKGCKYEDMAKRLDVSRATIIDRIAKLKKSGELSAREAWSNEQVALLKDMYKQGCTQADMAKKLGKSKAAVNNRICKLRAKGELDE